MINKILAIIFIFLLATIFIEVGYLFFSKNKLPQPSSIDSCSLSRMLYERIQSDKKNKTDALLQPDVQAILGNIVKNNNSTYMYEQKTVGYAAKVQKYDEGKNAMIELVEKKGGKVIFTTLVQVKDPHLYTKQNGEKQQIQIDQLQIGDKVSYSLEMNLATKQSSYELIQE